LFQGHGLPFSPGQIEGCATKLIPQNCNFKIKVDMVITQFTREVGAIICLCGRQESYCPLWCAKFACQSSKRGQTSYNARFVMHLLSKSQTLFKEHFGLYKLALSLQRYCHRELS